MLYFISFFFTLSLPSVESALLPPRSFQPPPCRLHCPRSLNPHRSNQCLSWPNLPPKYQQELYLWILTVWQVPTMNTYDFSIKFYFWNYSYRHWYFCIFVSLFFFNSYTSFIYFISFSHRRFCPARFETGRAQGKRRRKNRLFSALFPFVFSLHYFPTLCYHFFPSFFPIIFSLHFYFHIFRGNNFFHHFLDLFIPFPFLLQLNLKRKLVAETIQR